MKTVSFCLDCLRHTGISGILGRAVILMIKVYRMTLSRLLGDCCRFHPSCSVYCVEAIEKHGVWRGLFLGALRLGKCHPFHPGGIDPVPPA